MLKSAVIGEQYISLGSYAIGAVHTPNDLAALRAEWSALHHKSARPTLYLSWDWVTAWWEVYREADHQLWVLCARRADSGELVGIAPLALMPQPGPLRNWRVLTLMGLWAGYHLDFIIQPGEEVPITSAFMSYLHQRNREWDLIDLINLDADSPCLDGLFMNDTWYTRYTDAYLYIDFEGTWEDYWMGQTGKHRNTLTRRERHLRRDYPDREITYRIHRDIKEGQQVFDALMALMYRRWADEGDTLEHYLERPMPRFTRAAAEIASRLGCMRLYSMWVGDQIIATELILTEDGTDLAHFYRTAFDREWSQYDGGMLLFNYVLRDLIEMGVRHLELGEGVTEQKLRYGTGQNLDLYIRTAGRRDVQLWLQSVEVGRGVWKVIKQALPRNTRDAIRQALGYGEPGVTE